MRLFRAFDPEVPAGAPVPERVAALFADDGVDRVTYAWRLP